MTLKLQPHIGAGIGVATAAIMDISATHPTTATVGATLAMVMATGPMAASMVTDTAAMDITDGGRTIIDIDSNASINSKENVRNASN